VDVTGAPAAASSAAGFFVFKPEQLWFSAGGGLVTSSAKCTEPCGHATGHFEATKYHCEIFSLFNLVLESLPTEVCFFFFFHMITLCS
jgi:hypothetical protein